MAKEANRSAEVGPTADSIPVSTPVNSEVQEVIRDILQHAVDGVPYQLTVGCGSGLYPSS